MLRNLRLLDVPGVQFAAVCSLLVIGFAPLKMCEQASAQSSKPNVVVFLADDMGWTDWQQDPTLNPNGSVVYETPSLLQLAQASVSFSNAYASAPICSPTRSAILTGKSPARTKLTNFLPRNENSTDILMQPNWSNGLQASEITLSESLRSAGYATGFFGKWHLGNGGTSGADPLQNGFDTNVGGTTYGSPNLAGGYFAGSDGRWVGMPGLDTLDQYPSDKYLSDALNEHASSFIAQNSSGPFFLMLSDYLVHIDLEAPPELITKYQNKINTLQSQGVDLKGHTNATYAAMIEKMDQSVGMLLNRLSDPNGDGNQADSIRDDTIFVFTSDNGGLWAPGGFEGAPTQNLPLREGKGSLYEGGIREPLLVSWTGNSNLAPGTSRDALTSSYDLYPTILDLTGLENDPNVIRNSNMDGVSIRTALEGGAFERDYLYWHYPHQSNQDRQSSLVSGGTFVSAVADGDWKLLFFYEDRHYELYNLGIDIGESSNVLGQNPFVAAELSQALNTFLASVGAQMPLSKATGQAVALPPVLLIGDYDRNGAIATADYTLWRNTFGQAVPYGTGADGNGDGVIDAADYVLWRKHFSASGGGSLANGSVSVPEPYCLALTAEGLAFLCWLPRYHCRRTCRRRCRTFFGRARLAARDH